MDARQNRKYSPAVTLALAVDLYRVEQGEADAEVLREALARHPEVTRSAVRR